MCVILILILFVYFLVSRAAALSRAVTSAYFKGALKMFRGM